MKGYPVGKTFRNVSRWFGARKLALVAIVLIAILVMPQPSEGQFIPSPCCAILSAGLSSISSAISNVIGSALNAINATMTSIDVFQRTVIWPEDLINRAKGVVGAVQGIFNQVRGLSQTPVVSATLPATQQLEQTLLSADVSRINAVDSQYAAVYSAVPPSADASPDCGP